MRLESHTERRSSVILGNSQLHDIYTKKEFDMGSTGSGRFTDYSGTTSSEGEAGGASGTDKCLMSFNCILEDVAISAYYTTNNSLPNVGDAVQINFGQSRIVAIEVKSQLSLGALPTQFNYLGSVDLCCTYFTQQYIGSHIIVNASDTILA